MYHTNMMTNCCCNVCCCAFLNRNDVCKH